MSNKNNDVSQLERDAHRYANSMTRGSQSDINLRVNLAEQRFGMRSHHSLTRAKCNEIYSSMKASCKFQRVLFRIADLFENGVFQKLRQRIANLNDTNGAYNLYNEGLIAEIYRTVFGVKDFLSIPNLKLIQNPEVVQQMKWCVRGRLEYHYQCDNASLGRVPDYNWDSHLHEIFVCVYIHDQLVEIQDLLNRFAIRAQELSRESSTSSEQSSDAQSSVLSEEPFTPVLSRRSEHKRSPQPKKPVKTLSSGHHHSKLQSHHMLNKR